MVPVRLVSRVWDGCPNGGVFLVNWWAGRYTAFRKRGFAGVKEGEEAYDLVLEFLANLQTRTAVLYNTSAVFQEVGCGCRQGFEHHLI